MAPVEEKKVVPKKKVDKPASPRVQKLVEKKIAVAEKDLKEVDLTRDPCSIVFIGHVDAGKSTICG